MNGFPLQMVAEKTAFLSNLSFFVVNKQFWEQNAWEMQFPFYVPQNSYMLVNLVLNTNFLFLIFLSYLAYFFRRNVCRINFIIINKS